MSNSSDIIHHYSIGEYYSKQNKSCGYCSSSDGSHSYGLYTHSLRAEDYQDMIDRGWRRCGKYCYKSVMDKSCCPLYTIRCAAQDFRLSRTQKKILKKFNNFLIHGTVAKNKIQRNTEIVHSMDTQFLNHEKIDQDRDKVITFSVDASIHTVVSTQDSTHVETEISDPIKHVPSSEARNKEQTIKNKGMKAKQLRIQRKRQKLQNLGLTEEEISKKLVEKKRYPVVKTIEDFLKETESKSTVHNLKISLVRSCPRSESFNNTFAVAFDLFKRYQKFIHKDTPEKLTKGQFERFLVNSPLQVLLVTKDDSEDTEFMIKIELVHVESFEFKKSFKESALLFEKYQKTIHQESDEDCDVLTFHRFLIESPLKAVNGYGSYHQQYWLDDKLIAVGVIDILPKCVSSVYFFYDPDYAHLSLGTYGALREVDFTRKLSSRFPDLIYYYMGFYIHSCIKMKYKGAFKPSYLLCPEVYTWHPIEDCLPKIEASKYSRLNEDLTARDENSDVNPQEVLIIYNQTAMSLSCYLQKRKNDPNEREETMECARLIGKTCARNMFIVRT